MIRPFGLNDILLVRRLQRNSAALAIEHILTHPRAPLWIALTAPWPWAGIGVATYVLDERDQGVPMAGFVQLIKRSTRPEADLLHLAPALPAVTVGNTLGEGIWNRLLSHCTVAAGVHGLQRIFVSIADRDAGEACLKESGFSLYTRETIHRLALAPSWDDDAAGLHGAKHLPAGFRRQLPQDSWALQRLYARGTPRLVQQAEGAVTGQVGSPPLSWWEPDHWHGLVWEPAGEIRGAVQVHVGRAGHWLRVWGVNMLTTRELRALVESGLRAITDASFHRPRRPLPVHVTVRDYEMGLRNILTGFGFAPYLDRARFVKHTSATARKPSVVTPMAREVAREVAVRTVPYHSF